MITADKDNEVLCMLYEFCKNSDAELTKKLRIAPVDVVTSPRSKAQIKHLS